MATVYSINVSSGGVPKTSVLVARVTIDGIDGDSQRDREDHGGPDRAVSIYSLELIEALRQEGHPIAPGTTGENVTVSELEWSAIRRGTVLEAGDVILEVTSPAFPCKQIADSFLDRRFVRISDKLHPGWSRWYCRVLREGTLIPGTSIEIRASKDDASLVVIPRAAPRQD